MLVALCRVHGGGGRGGLNCLFFPHYSCKLLRVFTILPAKLWWIKGFEHHQGCWYCGCSADRRISNSSKYCCGPWWGRGNGFLLSSFSFVTKSEQKSPRSDDNVAAPCDRVFFSWRNKCLVCSSRFCFCPLQQQQKAKDPGGGTPDVVGTGFEPLRCLAF